MIEEKVSSGITNQWGVGGKFHRPPPLVEGDPIRIVKLALIKEIGAGPATLIAQLLYEMNKPNRRVKTHDGEEWFCKPNVEIQRELGCSGSSITRYIAEAKKYDLISVARLQDERGNACNYYRLNDEKINHICKGNSKVLRFQASLNEVYGKAATLVLMQLDFLIKNSNEKWIGKTEKEWAKQIKLSTRQFRRHVSFWKGKGIFLVKKPNGYNRTNHITIDYTALNALTATLHKTCNKAQKIEHGNFDIAASASPNDRATQLLDIVDQHLGHKIDGIKNYTRPGLSAELTQALNGFYSNSPGEDHQDKMYYFQRFFVLVTTSDFLKGNVITPKTGKPFEWMGNITLMWLLEPETAKSILEDKYGVKSSDYATTWPADRKNAKNNPYYPYPYK